MKLYLEKWKEKNKGEITVQFMDYEKLHLYLNWKPKYKFDSTLPALFKWYKAYFKRINFL